MAKVYKFRLLAGGHIQNEIRHGKPVMISAPTDANPKREVPKEIRYYEGDRFEALTDLATRFNAGDAAKDRKFERLPDETNLRYPGEEEEEDQNQLSLSQATAPIDTGVDDDEEEEDGLEQHTVDELHQIAEDENVETVNSSDKKGVLIQKIRAARNEAKK